MLETENSWFKEEGLELGIDTVQGCLVLRALFRRPLLAMTAGTVVLLGEVAF